MFGSGSCGSTFIRFIEKRSVVVRSNVRVFLIGVGIGIFFGMVVFLRQAGIKQNIREFLPGHHENTTSLPNTPENVSSSGQSDTEPRILSSKRYSNLKKDIKDELSKLLGVEVEFQYREQYYTGLDEIIPFFEKKIPYYCPKNNDKMQCLDVTLPFEFEVLDETALHLYELSNLVELRNYLQRVQFCLRNLKAMQRPALEGKELLMFYWDKNVPKKWESQYPQLHRWVEEESCSFIETRMTSNFEEADVVLGVEGSIDPNWTKLRGDNSKVFIYYWTETLVRAINQIPTTVDILEEIVVRDVDMIMHFSPYSTIPWNFQFYDRFSVGKNQSRSELGDYKIELMKAMETKEKEFLGVTFISNCWGNYFGLGGTRYHYLSTLGKFINFDNYGSCDFRQRKRKEKKFENRFESKSYHGKFYKFYFAFENSVRDGYVTEKLYETIRHLQFTVPVYWGSLNVKSYLPPELRDKKVFINANAYPNPKDLANYLEFLNQNDEKYLEYFEWRINGEMKHEWRFDYHQYNDLNPICLLSNLLLKGRAVCDDEE